MKKYLIILMILLITVMNFANLKIAVSIVPEKYFVERIAGEKAEVFELIPPGYSAANYAPTTRQLIEFADSDLYFSIGVPTEEANILPRIAQNAPDVKIIDLAGYVDSKYAPRYFTPEKRDPHIWLSPKRMIAATDKIAEELSRIDEANTEFYHDNAEALKDNLYTLDKELNGILQNLQYRGFFIYHPAFGYFGDDYDLKMYALEKDGKEATPKRLAEMIDTARDKGIKVIFYQTEIDSSQVETFAGEIGGKALQVNPLAYDYIDNLKKVGDTFKDVLSDE
ncbi:MAG TPA: zinc ABC transporter substrate-binding protein [Thermotogota bacterium]|nr:zinc ABC transporter substrate-binding protein [Thermotogota bacterium]HPJ87661.1 zinc ABC transporter substrate-binding protein [Thermotogota bacterium]